MNKKKLRALHIARDKHPVDRDIRKVLKKQATDTPGLDDNIKNLCEIKNVGEMVAGEILFSLWSAIEKNDGWNDV